MPEQLFEGIGKLFHRSNPTKPTTQLAARQPERLTDTRAETRPDTSMDTRTHPDDRVQPSAAE